MQGKAAQTISIETTEITEHLTVHIISSVRSEPIPTSHNI